MAFICRHCGCECERDSADFIGYEGVEGSDVMVKEKWKPLPKWMKKVKDIPPLPKSFVVCSCPCHWRGDYSKKDYLKAVGEIYRLYEAREIG